MIFVTHDRMFMQHLATKIVELDRAKLYSWSYDYPIKLAGKLALRKLKLLQLFGLKVIGNKKAADALQEDQDYFCSELCYNAFKAGGLDIVPQIGDGETTSPGDIAKSPAVEKVS